MNRRLAALCVVGSIGALVVPGVAGAFTISGTVRNPSNAPVPAVNIKLFDDNGNPIGIPVTLTNAAGIYSITGLPNGRYDLQFEPPIATRLVATLLPRVEIQNNNPVADAGLSAGFMLSGFVRDVNGVGIQDIDLNVSNGGTSVITPGDNTDASGYYDVIVPAGSWDVEWRRVVAAQPNYIKQVQTGVSFASDVVINVTLEVGFIVSGTVRNALNQPVAAVNLDFVDEATGIALATPGDNTNALGQYSVHIPVRSYTIQVKPLPATLLVPQQLTEIALNAATTLDFSLQNGILLQGTVRRTDLSPVVGVDIDVNAAATGARLYTPNDNTNALGQYSAVVPAGTFNVAVQPPVATLLVAQRHIGVVVSAPTTLNATLQPGVLVSGTVTRSGVPVAGVDIDATLAGTGIDMPLVGDRTTASGTYAVVLPPNTYDVTIEPPFALGLLGQKITGVGVPAATTLNAVLQPGLQVSGRCVDAVGEAVENVDIDVINPVNGTVLFTNGDKSSVLGQYGVVVPAGTWRFVFTPDPAQIVATPITVQGFVVNGNRTLHARFTAMVTTDTGAPANVPRSPVTLRPNVPNPFNPTTVLEYEVGAGGVVHLDVFDARGHLVRTLWRGARPAGTHRVVWDGRDDDGRPVSSGTYYARLEGHGASDGRKLVLVR